MEVTPTRTVLVDGRIFEAGTLYSVADDVAERITAACAEEADAEVAVESAPAKEVAGEGEEAPAVEVESEPEAADDSDADDAGVAPTA